MLPTPPEEGTKRERVARSFAQVPDSDPHTVALNLSAEIEQMNKLLGRS
ncbi:hypothetical protein ACFQ9Q_42850 [Streptomyces virginiae]